MTALLAVGWSGPVAPVDWRRAAKALEPTGGVVEVSERAGSAVIVATVGEHRAVDQATGAVHALLVRGARVGDRDVTPADVRSWLAADQPHPALADVMPPFAAVSRAAGSSTVRVASDALGLRCVYTAQGPGWAAVSTSTRALAALTGADVDLVSLAAFSLVGWRLGQRTHYEGVTKVPAGGFVTVCDGQLRCVVDPHAVDGEAVGNAMGDAAPGHVVRDAAEVLRVVVGSVLRDHPDTWLQLTGGLDSRILLAAVAPRDRSRIAAMTLVAPGSEDATLAAALAVRHGMRHHTAGVATAEEVTPEQAVALAERGAARVDVSADPLAWAALDLVERHLPRHPRLSGLGGEVVRGFYYVGPVVPLATTPRRVHGLARWRLFPNEGVPDVELDRDFVQWRREVTTAELEQVFAGFSPRWHEATDQFYRWQRMQRWAAAATSSTCGDRLVVNPMLDPRFTRVGDRVPPRDRARMRFLARLLVELDPALAELPLDGRPAPRVYARGGLSASARLLPLAGARVVGKVRQRTAGAGRPPAGGPAMAARVVKGWRERPEHLAALEHSTVLRPGLVADIISGRWTPAPSTVAFLVGLGTGARIEEVRS